jgi:hypothetical protein
VRIAINTGEALVSPTADPARGEGIASPATSSTPPLDFRRRRRWTASSSASRRATQRATGSCSRSTSPSPRKGNGAGRGLGGRRCPRPHRSRARPATAERVGGPLARARAHAGGVRACSQRARSAARDGRRSAGSRKSRLVYELSRAVDGCPRAPRS